VRSSVCASCSRSQWVLGHVGHHRAMEPLAIAGYVMIAGAAVLAVILGALAGALAWGTRVSVLWAGALAAGAYFTVTVLLESARLAPAAIIGMPPLILTLLTSWLAAHYLEVRARLRRVWATLVALACALLIGLLWGSLFRLGFWVPISVALAADVCLIALFYRRRSASAQ
jgi:hypothetical protein